MSVEVHPLFVDLCDDAAVFPPGNVPLADAVPAHVWHQGSAHAPWSDPSSWPRRTSTGWPRSSHASSRDAPRLALTVPLSQLAAAVAYVERSPVAWRRSRSRCPRGASRSGGARRGAGAGRPAGPRLRRAAP